MIINESDLWAEAFDKDFDAIENGEYLEYIESGGRHSTKSSFIAEAIIYLMQMNPHLSAVIVRKHSNTLRRSVYEKIKWAMNKWQVRQFYKISKSETAALPMIDRKTNQQIIFTGADDPEKLKSIALADTYTGILWFEEMTEFTPAEIESIKISVLRDGEQYNGNYWVFGSYNPPSSPRHWINAEMRKPRSDRYFHHSTYLDIPDKWISSAVKSEIEYMKANNPRAYENIYLGKATGTGTNVFENIELREITKDEISKFDYLYFGIDWGYYPDPFIYVQMAYDAKKATLYIFDELKLLKHGNYQASEKLKEHLTEWYGKDEYGYCLVNFMDDRITADSAEPKSVADFRVYGWNCRGAIKGAHSLEAGFKWLQSLNKIVIDPTRCPNAADEFTLYEHEIDKQTGEILAGYPQGQPDHAMAAVRYAMETVWRHGGE